MSNTDPNTPQPYGDPTRSGQLPPPPPAYGQPGQPGQPPAYGQPGQPPPPPAYGQPPAGTSGSPGYGSMPPPAPHGMPAATPYGMPGGDQVRGPFTRPRPMDLAVKLMQAGGVLSLLNLLTVFLFRDQIREAVEEGAATTDSAVDIDTIVTFSIISAVVFGLIGALLWFWMASANGKGKSWARILASVFYALSLLSFVLSFTQAQPAVARILSLIGLAIGTAAMVAIWNKESTAYYRVMSTPR